MIISRQPVNGVHSSLWGGLRRGSLRKGSLLVVVFGLAIVGTVFAPNLIAYNNGVDSSDREYDCGGSCHDTVGTCSVTMSTSNATPEPGGTVTVWVNVSGGEASDSPLGVMIVCATTTSNSMPSADGWTILSDPSGTTTYNYYEVLSYEDSASLAWQLSAPDTLGIHVLFAREMHGNGGIYATDYSSGLIFTVTDYSGGNGDDGSDDGTTVVHVPTIVITSPSNSATVSGNMTVNANILSVDDIESATLKVDGTIVSELTAPPFSWTIDTTNMSEGGHVLVVSATDSTGDTVSKEIAVFVDNESELVSMLEWIVTMGAGTVAIISFTVILIVLALYIRKRVMERRLK